MQRAFNPSREPFQTNTIFNEIFNPMAMNMQGISFTQEKLQFLYCSVRGVLYDSINYFRPFQSFDTIKFCKIEFAYISSAH